MPPGWYVYVCQILESLKNMFLDKFHILVKTTDDDDYNMMESNMRLTFIKVVILPS